MTRISVFVCVLFSFGYPVVAQDPPDHTISSTPSGWSKRINRILEQFTPQKTQFQFESETERITKMLMEDLLAGRVHFAGNVKEIEWEDGIATVSVDVDSVDTRISQRFAKYEGEKEIQVLMTEEESKKIEPESRFAFIGHFVGRPMRGESGYQDSDAKFLEQSHHIFWFDPEVKVLPSMVLASADYVLRINQQNYESPWTKLPEEDLEPSTAEVAMVIEEPPLVNEISTISMEDWISSINSVFEIEYPMETSAQRTIAAQKRAQLLLELTDRYRIELKSTVQDVNYRDGKATISVQAFSSTMIEGVSIQWNKKFTFPIQQADVVRISKDAKLNLSGVCRVNLKSRGDSLHLINIRSRTLLDDAMQVALIGPIEVVIDDVEVNFTIVE